MSAEQIVISTFYKFVDLPNYTVIKESLLIFCNQHKLKGTILLAREGVNATISGERTDINFLYRHFVQNYGITLTNSKESFLDRQPFEKMKVRLKKEIVTMGVPCINGNDPGHYVQPEQWDNFIAREDVVLIDNRNKYEIRLGSFKGAINPFTNHFRDFPQWFECNQEKFVGKKIAMCCTGGIRCEKSTSYIKTKGIDEIYHLDGGILNYLEKFGDKNLSWYGDCFVFDDRIAVDQQLNQSAKVPRNYTKSFNET